MSVKNANQADILNGRSSQRQSHNLVSMLFLLLLFICMFSCVISEPSSLVFD